MQTLLLLEKSQFPSSYVWAMPKYIEFALVITRFFFYVKVLLLHELSYNQLAVLTKCFLDSRDVCCILFKYSQLLFQIYSGFSGSLSVNQSWVNDVHLGGL